LVRRAIRRWLTLSRGPATATEIDYGSRGFCGGLAMGQADGERNEPCRSGCDHRAGA